MSPLLDVRDVAVHVPIARGLVRVRTAGLVRAVDGVSLAIHRGETYGLVGESGCGKSTLGRAIVALVALTSGQVLFDGQDLAPLTGEALRTLRRRFQMVFQDAAACLDPRRPVGALLQEGRRAHGLSCDTDGAWLRELTDSVGLPATASRLRPHELSEGERRRVGVARALSVGPDLVVVDEPVAGLDVSEQARVLNLLVRLRSSAGPACLVITQDLAAARHVSDRMGVMYLGGLVEEGPAHAVHTDPQHPYTRALLAAVPPPDPEMADRRERILLSGEPPSPAAPPSGCRFHTRCPWTQPTRCAQERPELRVLAGADPGHRVACHFAEDVRAGLLRQRRAIAELVDAPTGAAAETRA